MTCNVQESETWLTAAGPKDRPYEARPKGRALLAAHFDFDELEAAVAGVG